MTDPERPTLTIVGLGPGSPQWCTPAVREVLLGATDIVGYGPYVALVDRVVGVTVAAVRHVSDNRVEAERARTALDLAGRPGGSVVVVSSGDAGVFGMASAVIEQLDADPLRWAHIDVVVEPGISAAHAVAARAGAPLGHDFCVLSLSDVRKPWRVIEQRLDAVAGADLAIAMYNPRSRHRPDQLGAALAIIGRHREPGTVVIVGRNVGRHDESVQVTTLALLDPDTVDMSTLLIIGSSTTRIVNFGARVFAYTPRTVNSV